MGDIKDILGYIGKYGIVVGSAAYSDNFNDIDIVVSRRGLERARKVLPGDLCSCFIGHLKSFDLEVPIEVFMYWYGPIYKDLARRKLITRNLFGVDLRCWPFDTYNNEFVDRDSISVFAGSFCDNCKKLGIVEDRFGFVCMYCGIRR